jgi:hypothetical protein
MESAELAGMEPSKVSAPEPSATESTTTMEASSATAEMPAATPEMPAAAAATMACPCWLSRSNKSGDYQAKKFICFHATNIALRSRSLPLGVRWIFYCLERGTEA